MNTIIFFIKKCITDYVNSKEFLNEKNIEKIIVNKIKIKNQGDFTTNFAFLFYKKSGKSLLEFANDVKNYCIKKYFTYFSKIEVSKGFINFYITNVFFDKILIDILNLKKDFGKSSAKNIKYNIEMISANPTGLLHLGHGRNAFIADSLSKILEYDGYKITKEYYVNDAGNQINILALTVYIQYLKLNKKISDDYILPNECYKGQIYESLAKDIFIKYKDKFVILNDEPIKNKKINDEKINIFFRKTSVDYFLNIIKKQLFNLDIHIDNYIFESKFYEKKYIDNILNSLKKRNVIYEKDLAIWLKTSEYGDEKDRVLIKSDGSYTYLLPDIAAHYDRMNRTKNDKFIDFFGADHHGYINRLLIALSLLSDKKDLFDIQIIQMVKLINNDKVKKMSKRAGNVIWLKDLLEIFEPSIVKYIFCSKSKSVHLNFDFDKLIQNNENNPVFYAQYAAVRCFNILEKAKKSNLKINYEVKTNLLTNSKEIQLIIEMDLFNNVIKDAAKNYEPHIICDYIQRITKIFHSYYNSQWIVNSKNIPLSEQRILLIKTFSQVLKNCFDIIGIKFKQKMY